LQSDNDLGILHQISDMVCMAIRRMNLVVSTTDFPHISTPVPWLHLKDTLIRLPVIDLFFAPSSAIPAVAQRRASAKISGQRLSFHFRHLYAESSQRKSLFACAQRITALFHQFPSHVLIVAPHGRQLDICCLTE
jgi:hypothetical protein